MLTIGIVLMLWIAACLFFVATTYGYYKARYCYDDDVFTNRLEAWNSGWKAGFDSGVETEKGKGYSEGHADGWKKGYEKGTGNWEEAWRSGYLNGGEAAVDVLDSMHMLTGSKEDFLKAIHEVDAMWKDHIPTPQTDKMKGEKPNE